MFSKMQSEISAHLIVRADLLRKNSHLADGMAMMRQVVDGGSGADLLASLQADLLSVNATLTLFRTNASSSMKELAQATASR